MNEKEYLNEERYKKSNWKVKIIGTIIILIGLSLIGFGIYTLVEAHNMQIPEMGASDCFDKSRNQRGKETTGMFMILPGIFVTIVGLIVRFLIENRREIMAYQMQQMMPIVKEGTKEMKPIASEAAKEISKDIHDGFKKQVIITCFL